MSLFSHIQFKKWNWAFRFEGRLYNGEFLDGVPHGFGILAYAEGEDPEEITSLYIGAFHQGKRHGRGYRVIHKETVKTRERKATYEDVMATAVFDSCGRVIHTDNITTVTEHIVYHSWEISEDGLWQEDRFVEPVQRDLSAFKDLLLFVQWDHLKDGKVDYNHLTKAARIGKADKEGSLSLDGYFFPHLTNLPDGRLMLADQHGFCHAFRPGETWAAEDLESRYTFTLRES